MAFDQCHCTAIETSVAECKMRIDMWSCVFQKDEGIPHYKTPHYCGVTLNASTIFIPLFTHRLTQKFSDPATHPSDLYWNDTAENSRKKKACHTARRTEMLALSLAHGSVNSLLGPLAQRGVQGCIEINQQLTSSHHHQVTLQQPKDLAGNQDTKTPEQTLFNPLKRKTVSKKMKKLKWEWQSRLQQTW